MNSIFFHGSKNLSLAQLDWRFSYPRRPFGPAIYLTQDKLVATMYANGVGTIYCVRLNGPLDHTVNLDLSVGEQSVVARDAIARLCRIQYRDTDIQDLRSRDAIYRDPDKGAMANTFLRNRGIWMVYGCLHPLDHSGVLDRGIQYAVLENECANIVKQLSPHDPHLFDD